MTAKWEAECALLCHKSTQQESKKCIIFYPLHIHISQIFTLNLLSLESRRNCSFLILQKREPSLKSLFHSQHQHTSGSHQLWGRTFLFSTFGWNQHPLGQTGLLDTVTSNKVRFHGIWLLGRFSSRQQCHSDLRAVFEELLKSQIVWSNPGLMWDSLQGTTDIALYKHYIFKECRRCIFHLFIFYLLLF